ncbi:MAG: THUMP domain-containing protein [Sulfuricaulis sp.]|nr:THUMP domain-containing protein [Sulfuricaulis sp.]
MLDWNVVVSIREDCYKLAHKRLQAFGRVDHTDYYNVFALKVEDVQVFLDALRQTAEQDPALARCLARVIPATRCFAFQSAEEFEAHAREAAAGFVPDLLGKTFYVRMHRRGFHQKLASQREEQLLDTFLLEQLARTDAPGKIRFADPDAVIAVETIGPWAGLSLWKREDRARYPFVRVN